MKRTIEIDDVLEEQTESAIADIRKELETYLDDNEPRTCPDWSDLDYSGSLHEIVDGAVPIYTRNIEAAWFLYGSEIESAYQDAGIGDNPRENDGMTALYCYIDAKCREWWHDNAEDIFEAWEKARNSAEFFKGLEARLGSTAREQWAAWSRNLSDDERAEQEQGGEDEANKVADELEKAANP